MASNPCSRHYPSGSSWPLDRSFRNTDLASFAFANRFLLAIRAYDRSSNQPSESSGELYLYRHLPERTLVPSRTVALEEETTNMRPVPLVLRILPGHILQHLFGRRGSELGIVSVCHLARRGVGHLSFHDLGVELCGSEGEVGGIDQKGLLKSGEKLRCGLTLVDIRRRSGIDPTQRSVPDLSWQPVLSATITNRLDQLPTSLEHVPTRSLYHQSTHRSNKQV